MMLRRLRDLMTDVEVGSIRILILGTMVEQQCFTAHREHRSRIP